MDDKIPLESYGFLKLAAIIMILGGIAAAMIEPLQPLVSIGFFGAVLLYKLRTSSFTGQRIPVIGEGGVRAPYTNRWVPFEEIGELRFRKMRFGELEEQRGYKDIIEVFDRVGRHITDLKRPDGEEDFLEQLEAAVAATRHATDPGGFGKGASGVGEWLTGLERRFLSGGDYRNNAIDLEQALRALRDVHQPGDVRAGAAVALLSSRDPSRLAQVRTAVNHSSPPLLICVCNAIEPGLIAPELAQEARGWLTRDERAAMHSFGSRRAVRTTGVRVATDAASSVQDDAEEVESIETEQARGRAL